MSFTHPPDAIRLLRNRMAQFLAWMLGKLTCTPPAEPITVEDDDGSFRVWLRLAASGTSPDDTLNLVQPPPVGRHLSDRGERLVALLKEKGPLTRIAAARLLGWADKSARQCNPMDLGLFNDMLDRGCIVDYNDGEGIQLPS